MCCIQINSDVLFENVLGSGTIKKKNIKKVSFRDIENCSIFLENNLPGYVDCEVNKKTIYRIAKSYGCIIENDEIINLSNLYIVKKKSTRLYPLELAKQIERVVDTFWMQKKDEQDVIRLKHVLVK